MPNVSRMVVSNSSLLSLPVTSVDNQPESSDSFIGDPDGASVLKNKTSGNTSGYVRTEQAGYHQRQLAPGAYS